MGKENEIVELLNRREAERKPKFTPPSYLSKEEYKEFTERLKTLVQEFADRWNLGNMIDNLTNLYAGKNGVELHVSYPGGSGHVKSEWQSYHSENTLPSNLTALDNVEPGQVSVSISGWACAAGFSNGLNNELVVSFGQFQPDQEKAVRRFSRGLLEADPQKFHNDVLEAIVIAHEQGVDRILPDPDIRDDGPNFAA